MDQKQPKRRNGNIRLAVNCSFVVIYTILLGSGSLILNFGIFAVLGQVNFLPVMALHVHVAPFSSLPSGRRRSSYWSSSWLFVGNSESNRRGFWNMQIPKDTTLLRFVKLPLTSLPTTTTMFATTTTATTSSVIPQHLYSLTSHGNNETNNHTVRIQLNTTTNMGQNKSRNMIPKTKPMSWMGRVQELLEYQQEHGDMLVPKRYKANPSLGNWVNRQRQQYKIYHKNRKLEEQQHPKAETTCSDTHTPAPLEQGSATLRPCSLTAQRIELLTSVGFCWDATNITAILNAGEVASWSPSSSITRNNVTDTPSLSLSTPLPIRSPLRMDFDHRQPQPNLNKQQRQQREDSWWKRLEELRCLHEECTARSLPNETRSHDKKNDEDTRRGCSSLEGSSVFLQIPTQSALGKWLNRQRRAYQEWKQQSQYLHDPPSTATTTTTSSSSSRKASFTNTALVLDQYKIDALNQIDPDWWKSTRERQWDVRYMELKAYREEHGDCCVPISYVNQQLAYWVSNQRKKYNLKQSMSGRSGSSNNPLLSNSSLQYSTLTDEQVERLNAIEFVWNRWEYEFEKKNIDLGF